MIKSSIQKNLFLLQTGHHPSFSYKILEELIKQGMGYCVDVASTILTADIKGIKENTLSQEN